MIVSEISLLLDGKSAPAVDGRWYDIPSPATGEIVGRAPAACAEDVRRAVQSSQSAFAQWSKKTAWEREKIIRAATAYAKTKASEIGHLMTLEQGKPLTQAIGEVVGACDLIDYYASEGVRVEGTVNQTEKPNLRSWVIYQPVGTCAAITPWNYPVALLAWKLGPAFAAGCSIVVKPSPVTPLSATSFCHTLNEGGLPAGLVNVVTGPDPQLGEALVAHSEVAKVAMTGSTSVGKRILESCAPRLKRVSLELGGHCPAIVCEDADLDLAAQTIAYKGFRNCGQSCSSVNRVYAHQSVHQTLVEKIKEAAEAMPFGDGISDPDVDNGPMTTREAVLHVEAHVSDALDKGATLICGGNRPKGNEYSRGNYYLPTILTNVTDEMLMMREETFGPVVPVNVFDKLEDAVREANATRWGLVSYLFSKDNATIIRVSEALNAGTICVNNGAVNTAYGPYEGWGDSGYGIELSRAAIFEYLKTKHIKVAL